MEVDVQVRQSHRNSIFTKLEVRQVMTSIACRTREPLKLMQAVVDYSTMSVSREGISGNVDIFEVIHKGIGFKTKKVEFKELELM